jgi:hypothetical protein
MNRRQWPLFVLALIALLGVIGAGCGSSTPPATTPGGSADAGGNTSAAGQEKAVKFAECMRQNGVGDFPDPDASGEFQYGVSVTPTVFRQAADACKDLQPPGVFSSKRNPEEQDAALEFARCVRQNGVKDFPDPVDGEPLINTYEIPSSNQPGGMDILNAATAKCRDLLEKAAAGLWGAGGGGGGPQSR